MEHCWYGTQLLFFFRQFELCLTNWVQNLLVHTGETARLWRKINWWEKVQHCSKTWCYLSILPLKKCCWAIQLGNEVENCIARNIFPKTERQQKRSSKQVSAANWFIAPLFFCRTTSHQIETLKKSLYGNLLVLYYNLFLWKFMQITSWINNSSTFLYTNAT